MAEVGKLSASKINLWNKCPYAYRLNYVDHIKVARAAYLFFGIQIHHMLDEFYKKDFKSAESIANAWRFRWRSVVAGDFLKDKERQTLEVEEYPYTLKRSGAVIDIRVGNHIRFWGEADDVISQFFMYRDLGEFILRGFYERHKPQGKPLATEERVYFDFSGYPMVAVLDRVDEKDGDFYVTDYKTNRDQPTTLDLQELPQLTIYSAAFRHEYGTIESSMLFYHLRSGKVLVTHRDEEDFDTLEQICVEVSKGITQERFGRNFIEDDCRFCDFLRPCIKGETYYEELMRAEVDESFLAQAEAWIEALVEER